MPPHPSPFGSAADLDALASLKVSTPAHDPAVASAASPATVAGARALAGALGKSPLSGASPGTARWCAGEAPRTSPVSVLMISALNLSVVRTIFVSWVITLPAGAILSIVFFYVLRAAFGG